MRILVTGGAGFIGSHVVDAFVAAGHEVAVVDDLSAGTPANLHPQARFYQVDIRTATLEGVFLDFGPEVVAHHAAQPSVKVSTENPSYDAAVNVLGTINLLDQCTRAQVRKIIFVSTGGAIYGDPRHLPIDEDHPPQPISPYAIGKLAGEQYVRYFGAERDLDWTILRYANVYGPRQDPYGEAGVVAIFSQQLLTGEVPEIHWDGEQSRDFVYVQDVAQANLLALDGGSRGVYNVGTGVGTTINVLFAIASRLAGRNISPRRGPRRTGDVRASYLSCKRIRRDLGWTPQTRLEQGLAETLAFFVQASAANPLCQQR